MQIKSEDIDPNLQFGINAIDQLSEQVTASKMPYATKYTFVQDAMKTLTDQLPMEQRANPAVRMKAYEMAVGQCSEQILNAEREEWQRQVTDQQTQDVGGHTGRDNGGTDSGIPKPEDVLTADSIAAIKGLGKTVDQYYQGLGYDNWEAHYTANKEFYES
jgi:hypothetical protein